MSPKLIYAFLCLASSFSTLFISAINLQKRAREYSAIHEYEKKNIIIENDIILISKPKLL